MNILITAFEPFGDIDTNCTQMVLKEIENIAGVETLLLPVSSDKAFPLIERKLKETSYDFVILLGQSAGRSFISLERVALNLYDFPIADNEGVVLKDTPIYCDEENAMFSDLPLREIEEALGKTNLEVQVSNSAGTYICNEVFFKGLVYTKNSKTRLGFVHFPVVREQNCRKFTTKWSLSDLCLAMVKIIEVLPK